jgi:hypothetical protein
MNRARQKKDPLLSAVTAALKDLGIAVQVTLTREEPDAMLAMRTPAGSHAYQAEIKRNASRALLGPITAAFSGRAEESLLVTDYVSPPLAEEFRRNGIQFADAAGNAFLRRTGLFVFVSGRKPAERPRGAPTPRLFRPTGLKILFALLSVPELVNATQREIAAAAGVALGNVPVIFDAVRQLGFIAEVRGKRRLFDAKRLQQQWTEAYARSFEPTLELARFTAADSKWWRRADITRYAALWGGETAAALLHRHLVPERVVIYTRHVPPKLLVEHRLKADPDGDVVFRQRFWNFDPPWKSENLVPPLLIYADLLAAGDGRSLAAAKQIHDEYLARLVENR